MIGRPDFAMRGIRVAVVDDEPAVLTALRRLCTAAGMHADGYCSGSAFIAALESRATNPDCVLLDVQMPEMSGLDVQHYLTARKIMVPAIIVTADDAPELRERCLAAGAAAYLHKPVGADDLFAAILGAVTKAQGARL